MYRAKIAWYRAAAGTLRVFGRRLDGPGWMTAQIPKGYGRSGVQPTGLLFSERGCWEVSGMLMRLDRRRLSKVTIVIGV